MKQKTITQPVTPNGEPTCRTKLNKCVFLMESHTFEKCYFDQDYFLNIKEQVLTPCDKCFFDGGDE